jgi:hypothetical protein
MNIVSKVTISRNSHDVIHIQIKDTASGARFVEVHMTPEDFAMAITGLSEIEAPAFVRDLHVVGQNKITEPRTVVCPLDTHEKEVLRAWVQEHCQEPGWQLSAYLGSQTSVAYNHADRTNTLRYSVYRYEPKA